MSILTVKPAGWDKAFLVEATPTFAATLSVHLYRFTIFRKFRKLLCTDHNVWTRHNDNESDNVGCVKCGRIADTKDSLILKANQARHNWWKLKTWRTL